MKEKKEELLVNKQKELEKEIANLKNLEHKNKIACIKEILQLPEAKKVKNLCSFKQKWTMPVTVEIECDFWIDPFDGDLSCEGAKGTVCASFKKINKGYNIESFFYDDSIGNVGMQDDMETVSPGTRKQFKDLLKAERDLKKKARKIAKKFGYGLDDILYDLAQELSTLKR